MSRQAGVSQWTATVSTQLPHLSRPQATVLAAWSCGIVLAQGCGLPTVATFLAALLDQRENTVRQRLREWYRDAADRGGAQRQELDVGGCFAPLLRWVLAWWPADERRLVLALDATSLGDRFVVWVIGVVYRGWAIPVAWHVLPANQPGAWRPHPERLLASCSGPYGEWHGRVASPSARGQGVAWRWLRRANRIEVGRAGGSVPLSM